MKIKDFVKQYQQDTSIIDTLEIAPYVNIERKMNVIGNLLTSIHYSDTKFTLSSTFVHLMLPLVLIDEYTDLEVDFENIIEEYDLLCEQDLIVRIVEKINPKEVQEFTTILEKKQSDMIFNNTSPQAFITENVERFGAIIGTLLSPVVEKLADTIQGLDATQIEKINSFIGTVVDGTIPEKADNIVPIKTTKTRKTKK